MKPDRSHDEQIPFFQEINDFLAAIPSPYRTADPLVYCLRVRPDDTGMNNYMAPFRKGFYFMGLVTNAGSTRITYDSTDVTRLDSFLVFQAPGHIYSFYRDSSAEGFLIYFKRELFSFYKPDLDEEFPFFDIRHTNFFRISQARYQELRPWFELVFSQTDHPSTQTQMKTALAILLSLVQLKEAVKAMSDWEQGFSTPQRLLLQKYIRLVDHYYLEKRTVEEYASLLAVTPNHLSQAVKDASGKRALSVIAERVLKEAQSLIRFTPYDMAEIAWRLNFSDPAHFGKFFKKHTGLTPLEYRSQFKK